jgi:hypothetical protein
MASVLQFVFVFAPFLKNRISKVWQNSDISTTKESTNMSMQRSVEAETKF